jgi:hypothetical protein
MKIHIKKTQMLQNNVCDYNFWGTYYICFYPMVEVKNTSIYSKHINLLNSLLMWSPLMARAMIIVHKCLVGAFMLKFIF